MDNKSYLSDLNLSPLGAELFDSVIDIIETILKTYGKLRTQVFYPKKNEKGEIEILSIELSKIIDQIIEEFGLKAPFENKESPYFSFFRETALNILKIKIENESPNSYIFVSQNENIINGIIRDPSYFGITKITMEYKIDSLYITKVEHLPSNSYTNPLFIGL